MRVTFMCMAFFVVLMLNAQDNGWLNSSKDIDARVSSLISEMTIEEKISQMGNSSPSIPRLGIEAYNWWNEALHGVARSARATVFPQAIGLGATFDPDLMKDIGEAVSDEARAINNHLLKTGKEQKIYMGLTFWSPNVNIFRDPRWGRGQETYGEDPFLSGKLGSAFIRGMQGDHPKYLKVATCAKHFAVHSGPEALRHGFNAISGAKDMHETYLPAFKMCIDAGVEAVMCAYNRTNNEACCGSNYLLKKVLVDDWNFQGHIVSDCGALKNFHGNHNLTSDVAQSVALALKNGVTLNCGKSYDQGLKLALDQKLITEEELDERLHRLLKTRFKLGMFDDPAHNPYRLIGVETINDQAKQELALKAARESVVMLKNNGILPLNKNSDFVYLIGPLATNTQALVGNYNGVNSEMVTILEGVAGKVSPSTRIEYRQGALISSENVNNKDWYSPNAGRSDVTIAVLGLTSLLEGEEGESIASPSKGDVLDMKLPESQMVLLRKINTRARDNGKKIVTVICAGMPLDLSEVERLSDAVIYAWYPGERGGEALAEILFGEISPSGKLPITFPKSADQLPAFDDYSMKGRTYRYMQKEPMYPFGFGLSYADLEWNTPEFSKSTIGKDENLQISVEIKNNSEIDADEVVQLYLELDVENTPLASLLDFERISIAGGEREMVTFSVSHDSFFSINEQGDRKPYIGKAQIIVSNASPGDRTNELECVVHRLTLDIR